MQLASVLGPAKFALRVVGTGLWAGLMLIGPLGIRIDEAFWATAFFSCLIFYLAYRRKFAELSAMLAATVALGCFHIYMQAHRLLFPSLGIALAELGLGAILVVGIRTLWSDDEEDRRILLSEVLVPTGLLVLFMFAANNLINNGLFHLQTMDLYAYSFDGSLGFQPSFALGRLVQAHPWFGWPTIVMYYCILLPIPLAYVAYKKKFGNVRRFFMLSVFFSASFLGYLFYNLFPAAGPVYVFGRLFPWTSVPAARLMIEPIIMSPTVMRNALPSLHMTWALLIWWNMKAVSRALFWIAFVYAIFTICGTLGTGEHYAVDLVVAFPFALMIQSICTSWVSIRSRVRWVGIVGGWAGTLGWVALLRYANHLFWVSTVISWALVLITVLVSQWWLFRLLKAAESDVQEPAEISALTEGKLQALSAQP